MEPNPYPYTPTYILPYVLYEYVPNPYLKVRYDLLIKYDLLKPLDDMVWRETCDLTEYLMYLGEVGKEVYEEEFFGGLEIELLDLLKGDLSELAPILYDRIRLRVKFEPTLIEEDLFTRIVKYLDMRTTLYRNYYYFNPEGGSI